MMDDSPEGHTQFDIVAETKVQAQSLAVNENYVIGSRPEAETAAEALQKVKGLAKHIAEAKDAERRPLNEQLKAISARFKEAEDVVELAEASLKSALLAFQKAEDKRIAEQRRLEAQAAAAERARLEEDARKQREKAEREAEALRAKGRDEKADAVMQVAESKARAQETVANLVAAPTKPTGPTRFAGTTVRKTWRGKVIDMPVFLTSLAKSNYAIEEFVEVNQSALDRLAKSLQTKMDKAMPGTIAWEEENLSSRSK